jgi:hypothetical protein
MENNIQNLRDQSARKVGVHFMMNIYSKTRMNLENGYRHECIGVCFKQILPVPSILPLVFIGKRYFLTGNHQCKRLFGF